MREFQCKVTPVGCIDQIGGDMEVTAEDFELVR